MITAERRSAVNSGSEEIGVSYQDDLSIVG